jgi:hypothetical protein
VNKRYPQHYTFLARLREMAVYREIVFFLFRFFTSYVGLSGELFRKPTNWSTQHYPEATLGQIS